MQNETTRGLETPARQAVPIGSGTRTGTSELDSRTTVSVVPEPGGTSRTRLMSGTVFGSGMAFSQLEGSDAPPTIAREKLAQVSR